MPYIDNTDLFLTKMPEIEESILRDTKRINSVVQRMVSCGGVIPSLDFSWDDYQQFLTFATPYELENDILTKETVKRMANINSYGVDIPYEPDCEPKVELSLRSIANTKRKLKEEFKG